MNIEKRVALVTGASRGIGEATALMLSKRGHKVVLSSRSEESLIKVQSKIESLGGNADYLVCDNSDRAQVEDLIKNCVDKHKRLDILVNNAAVTRDGLALRMSNDSWEEVIQTNLTSVFIACRAALRPMMRSRWGRIVNIGSITGLVGNIGQSNYGAAKAGLIGMTKCIAKEIGSKGITANVVAPGFILTQMTDVLPEALLEEAKKQIPVGRLGDPEEIAATIDFLCSEKASYITGQVLTVDGGMTCT